MMTRTPTLAALSFLLAATPVRAQWKNELIPGSVIGKTSYKAVVYDPSRLSVLACNDNQVVQFDTATWKHKKIIDATFVKDAAIERTGPFQGPKIYALAAGGDGTFTFQVASIGPDRRMFRCGSDNTGYLIAGAYGQGGSLFEVNAPDARTTNLSFLSLAQRRDGAVFATDWNAHFVYLLSPQAPDHPGAKPVYSIRAIAGMGGGESGVAHRMSPADRAKLLEFGKIDARKVPLEPRWIVVTPSGDVLFTDTLHNRVFHLVPPREGEGPWTLEVRAGTGIPSGISEATFKGGSFEDATRVDLSPNGLAAGADGRIFIEGGHRLWVCAPNPKAGGKWGIQTIAFERDPETTLQLPGPDKETTYSLYHCFESIAVLPDGRVVAAGDPEGLRLLTPPTEGKAATAVGDTKKD